MAVLRLLGMLPSVTTPDLSWMSDIAGTHGTERADQTDSRPGNRRGLEAIKARKSIEYCE